VAVATVRDFLERLRPSGTPGAPAMSGVPADRLVERVAELEPVFARLADVQAEAERIRADAAAEAERRRRAATEEARSIAAEARRLAEAERGAAAAAAQAEARARAEQIVTEAHHEAAAITVAAESRRPDVVRLVRDRAQAELAAQIPGTP
jgi:hypothetical protein